MSWLAWTGIVVGILLVLYILWCAFWIRSYNSENDYSGDGGLAVLAMILLPFLPIIWLVGWLKDKFR